MCMVTMNNPFSEIIFYPIYIYMQTNDKCKLLIVLFFQT